MKNTFIYLLVILFFYGTSCKQVENISDESKQAEQALLATQAAWKNGKEITSDSLINIAVTFYSNQKDLEQKATALLYQGYVRESMGRDEEAMYCYKQAEETIKTIDNRELHFLVYTALAKLNYQYAHYKLAMNFYQKAVDLKLSVPTWHIMHKELAPLTLLWFKDTPRYDEIMKVQTETLNQMIERMDFASQETIYLQQALKCKDNQDWEAADSLLLKAIACTSIPEKRYRLYAELADVLEHTNRPIEADSLYTEALKSTSRHLKASIYKSKYMQYQTTGQTVKAHEALQKYVQELELLYTSNSRADLLAIEMQYDQSALIRQNEKYHRQRALLLLATVAIISTLAILLWAIWKFFRKQKEESLKTYQKEAFALQAQIDSLQEQMEENEGEAKNLQEQLACLEIEKREKDLRIRQLEVTFRAKRITLSAETAEAVQLYLSLTSRKNASYHPAEDRSKLAHWLNISRNRWADHLELHYPTLSNGEKDICYLFAIGISFDEMATFLQIQPRSVDRVVYRICKKMGMEQGNKDDFAKQLRRIDASL